jgi:hypothetical protein
VLKLALAATDTPIQETSESQTMSSDNAARAEPSNRRRRAPRYRVRLPVRLRTGQDSGSGVVVDMSVRGARIDESDVCPRCGTPVVLNLYLAPCSEPVPVVAEVVRQESPRGLAVEFRPLDPATLRFMGIVLTKLGLPLQGRPIDRRSRLN